MTGDIAAVVLAYLLGSIPTGLWLGKALRGIDIREHGSKNIGATNTMRVLGKGLGAAALAGDALKGVAAVLLGMYIGAWEHTPLTCGLIAILGHGFPLYLRFNGGKGVATSCGVFLTLAPIPTLIAMAVFAAIIGVTRMVSAGSITAAIVLAAAVWLMPHDLPLRLVILAVALFVVVKHRTNIQRIMKGEENKVW